MRKFVVPAARCTFWAAICLAAAAAPAAAEGITLYVKYSDLNLASAEGVETLEARIAAAVKTVCAKPEFIRDLKSMAAWESCKASAAVKAREQVETTVQLARL